MSKPRKSSLGRPPRPHIPYRADDLGQGKKTGVTVNYVDHKSDEFEPFDKVLTQADRVTPPLLNTRKRPRRSPSVSALADEDGEMSMELDDTNPDSPGAYFSNAPRPTAPSSANRTATSHRTSDIDYDRVPSPRPSSSARARPAPSHRSGTPARSRLSRSHIPDEDEAEDESPQEYHDMGGYDGDGGLPPSDQSPGPHSPRRNSFSQIDQDSDSDDGGADMHNEDILSTPPKQDRKGKQRALEPSDDDENEISQALDVDFDVGQGEEQVEDDPTPKRAKEAPQKPPKKPRVKKQDHQLSDLEANAHGEGVRRGARTRYKPLDWWRCEKVVYGRRESGTSMVPVIKDIIRLPKEEPQKLGTLGKRKRRVKRETSNAPAIYNPEEGWDDYTDPTGAVLDFVTQTEIQRRVAFTAKMVTPKPAANGKFMFQKIFGDGQFLAAGQLVIPPGGSKPSKGTKDNTYVFFLAEGAINLKVHRTSFVLATGAMFLIPRGNTYYIENISERDARLFFAQARKVLIDEEEAPPDIQPAPRKSTDPPGRRSSGGGAGTAALGVAPRATSAMPKRAQSVNGLKVDSKKRAVSK